MASVYINLCSEEELRLIPGIGVKLARKIMQLRESFGALTEEDFRNLPSIRNPEAALRTISFALEYPAGSWSPRMVEPEAPGQAAPSKPICQSVFGQFTPVTEGTPGRLSPANELNPKPTSSTDAEAIKSNLRQLEHAETNLQARRRGLTPQSHSALYDQWQAASHDFSREMEAFSDVLANMEVSGPNPGSGRLAKAPLPSASSAVHDRDVSRQSSRTKPYTEEIDPRVLQGAEGNVPQIHALTPGYRERRGTGQVKHRAPQPIPCSPAQGMNRNYTRETPSTQGTAISKSRHAQPVRDDSLRGRASRSREISDTDSEEEDGYVDKPSSSIPAGPREETDFDSGRGHGFAGYADEYPRVDNAFRDYPVYEDTCDHSHVGRQCSRSRGPHMSGGYMDYDPREHPSMQGPSRCRVDATHPVARKQSRCGELKPLQDPSESLYDDLGHAPRDRQRMCLHKERVNGIQRPPQYPQVAWREPIGYSSDSDLDEVRPKHHVRSHHANKQAAPLPRMLSYDGSTRWSSFYLKFQRFARSQQWNDEEKLDRLCYCLTGKAADFFTLLLERDEFISFQGMVRKLERRFGKQCQAETAQLQFPNLRQSSDESLEEWAERVLQVAIAAFPDLPDDFVEQQVVRRFCQGCANKEAAHYVSNLGLRTLESAMDAVQKYLQNTQAVYGRPVIRREVKQSNVASDSAEEECLVSQMTSLPNPTFSQHKRQTPSQSNWTNVMERLTYLEARVEEMSSDIRKLTAILSRRFRSPSSSPTRLGECFKCGKTGHSRRECPVISNNGRRGERKVTFKAEEKNVRAISDAAEILNMSGLSSDA